jgi:hypothetical protein
MRSLRESGIRVDSSYNPCYHPELSFPEDLLEPNVVERIEGVWECPVTVARTRLPEGYKGFKFACCSLSFPEMRTMLDAAAAAGQQHFVIVLHSFSAVKPKDETYAQLRPNRIVIRRLEKLFRYLAENPARFRVETMNNFPDLQTASPARAIVHLDLASSAIRKAVQLANNIYWV